jgi:pantoate--beta-alanine ligase
MILIHAISELKIRLAEEHRRGKTIGLVPTMGALHDGHLSLVKRCKQENDVCVVSIFVNPTQFNDRKDLLTYPRTLKKDYELLEPEGCDCVFAPSDDEMYPIPDTRVFQLGPVAEVMEGLRRPGHFNGVAQIVSKLFDIVAPDKAKKKKKDYQQIAVIREMVKQLNMHINLVACPTVRETDGLAMSSRNVRLTAEQRQFAPIIARTLKESLIFVSSKSVKEVETWVTKTLNDTPCMRVEYYRIVDSRTLQPIDEWKEDDMPIGCIAVFCGDVRLIDNIKYEFRK